MVHSAQLEANATKLFSKEQTICSSPAIPNGRSTSSRQNRAIQTGVPLSSRPISLGSIGKSGSRPWPRQRNIPGRSILFGKSCTTIPGPYRSWPAIHFQTHRPILFVRDFIATDSPRLVIRPGGNGNRSANGCPLFPAMTPSFSDFSLRWIGEISSSCQIPAFDQIKFTRGQDGNFFDDDGAFWNPKVRHASIFEFDAQVIHLNRIGS